MKQKMGFFIRKSSESGSSVSSVMPLVDIAVTLITHGDRILAVYNEKWGAFTLPMSKRRTWQDSSVKEDGERIEDWDDAALRAAAEWTGRTTTQKPETLMDMAEFQQSDRDAKWKRYHMQVFRLSLAEADVVQGARTEWLTPDAFLDEARRPISPTARHVLAELKLMAKL